jgi:hypothetical protein
MSRSSGLSWIVRKRENEEHQNYQDESKSNVGYDLDRSPMPVHPMAFWFMRRKPVEHI